MSAKLLEDITPEEFQGMLEAFVTREEDKAEVHGAGA